MLSIGGQRVSDINTYNYLPLALHLLSSQISRISIYGLTVFGCHFAITPIGIWQPLPFTSSVVLEFVIYWHI